MSTPVATIADALIAFILSLLRDPAAVEEFAAAPKAMMASNGLAGRLRGGRPGGQARHRRPPERGPKPMRSAAGLRRRPRPIDHEEPDEVVKEISRIINQFTTIDARSTIVDQSVNQNIWTNGGDVTQIFDQEAVVASGDEAVAAGDDATLVDSEVDVTVGDVSIGNTDQRRQLQHDRTMADDEAPDGGSRPGSSPPRPRWIRRSRQPPPALPSRERCGRRGRHRDHSEQREVSAPAEDPLAADLTSATDSYESDDRAVSRWTTRTSKSRPRSSDDRHVTDQAKSTAQATEARGAVAKAAAPAPRVAAPQAGGAVAAAHVEPERAAGAGRRSPRRSRCG